MCVCVCACVCVCVAMMHTHKDHFERGALDTHTNMFLSTMRVMIQKNVCVCVFALGGD